jgi:hypothetical protein
VSLYWRQYRLHLAPLRRLQSSGSGQRITTIPSDFAGRHRDLADPLLLWNECEVIAGSASSAVWSSELILGRVLPEGQRPTRCPDASQWAMITSRLEQSEIVDILVRRGPIPPGPLAIFAALYKAGDAGITEDALIDTVRWGDRNAFFTVLRGISRRVAAKSSMGARGHHALIAERVVGGVKRYFLPGDVRDAIEADPAIKRIMELSVKEILATRNPDDPQGDKSRWPRLRSTT